MCGGFAVAQAELPPVKSRHYSVSWSEIVKHAFSKTKFLTFIAALVAASLSVTPASALSAPKRPALASASSDGVIKVHSKRHYHKRHHKHTYKHRSRASKPATGIAATCSSMRHLRSSPSIATAAMSARRSSIFGSRTEPRFAVVG